MAKRTGKKKNTVSVDFSNTQGNNKMPEGDYQVRVKEVELGESQAGQPKLDFKLEVTEGKHEGKILYQTCSLQPQALFNLRNLLEAAEYPIESGAFDLDIDELIGLELGVTVEHEEYQGKTKNRIVDFFSLSEMESEDDEDEDDEDDSEDDSDDDEDSDDEGEDGDDSDEDDDDETSFEDMEDEELIEAAKDAEIEVPYTGKGKKKKLDREALIKLLEEAEEDEDSDDEDDEDDEDEDDDEVDEYTAEDLEEMDDEALVDAAGEVGAEAVYTGKGSKKKLNRKKTIAAIIEAQDEE
jgi:hypothetical protein